MPAQALDHAGGHFLAAALSHCLKQQRHEGGSLSVPISLARLAHELLGSRSVSASGTAPPPATLQTSTTDAGEITCAAPVLVYAGAPRAYPMLATPWGADAPAWQSTQVRTPS
jgi:hypothetical protein